MLQQQAVIQTIITLKELCTLYKANKKFTKNFQDQPTYNRIKKNTNLNLLSQFYASFGLAENINNNDFALFITQLSETINQCPTLTKMQLSEFDDLINAVKTLANPSLSFPVKDAPSTFSIQQAAPSSTESPIKSPNSSIHSLHTGFIFTNNNTQQAISNFSTNDLNDINDFLDKNVDTLSLSLSKTPSADLQYSGIFDQDFIQEEVLAESGLYPPLKTIESNTNDSFNPPPKFISNQIPVPSIASNNNNNKTNYKNQLPPFSQLLKRKAENQNKSDDEGTSKLKKFDTMLTPQSFVSGKQVRKNSEFDKLTFNFFIEPPLTEEQKKFAGLIHEFTLTPSKSFNENNATAATQKNGTPQTTNKNNTDQLINNNNNNIGRRYY